MAENLELNALAAGLQLDENFLGRRVLNCNRTHPENVLNLSHRSAGRNFSGFPGELEISDAGQRRNACDVVVVNKKVSLAECLFEELPFESRFVAIDKWMHAR